MMNQIENIGREMMQENRWLYAIGGGILGFGLIHMLNKRGMVPNRTGGGLHYRMGDHDIFIRQGGMYEGGEQGSFLVFAGRPGTDEEDLIGVIERRAKGTFRAFPVTFYDQLGVETDLPSFMLRDGVINRSLHRAAEYLHKVYHRAYKRSRAYEERLGRDFNEMLK